MKTAVEKTKRAGRTTAVIAAAVSAGLLVALAGKAREAEATFPGDNGRISFASNRSAVGENVSLVPHRKMADFCTVHTGDPALFSI